MSMYIVPSTSRLSHDIASQLINISDLSRSLVSAVLKWDAVLFD
jgi:hypothetical protein